MYNMRPLQSLNSNICDHYCLQYAYYRARGYEMQAIIDSFIPHNNFDNNDRLVYEHVIDRYNLDGKI